MRSTLQTGMTPTVEAVERACTILTTLEDLSQATLTELAAELDMNKATVYKHLNTLGSYGFVIRDEDGYQLSLRFLKIGRGLQVDNPLYQYGREYLDFLADASGEFAHLICEEAGTANCLYVARGNFAVGNDLEIGQESTLHHIAGGKAILAHLPPNRVDAILDHHGLSELTPHTITDRDRLYKELSTIRDKGYSLNVEEEILGIHAVGTPITGPNGDVLGAMSISGPAQRLDEERVSYLVGLLQYTRNVLELEIHDEAT